MLSIFGDLEHGIMAWAVGGVVGFGALLGSGRKVNPMNGVLAAVISVLAVFGGKYFAYDHVLTSFSGMVLTSYVADEVADEFMDAGRDFDWPSAHSGGGRFAEEHYPPEVWSEATDRWAQMGAESRSEYEARHQAGSTSGDDLEPGTGVVLEAIKEDLNLIDLLFIGLAIATAFRIGSGMMGGEE
tara:strand:- start:19081 stop:19635 length:555 start_codon:yes stop_codon:yes gene_type:complete